MIVRAAGMRSASGLRCDAEIFGGNQNRRFASVSLSFCGTCDARNCMPVHILNFDRKADDSVQIVWIESWGNCAIVELNRPGRQHFSLADGIPFLIFPPCRFMVKISVSVQNRSQ